MSEAKCIVSDTGPLITLEKLTNGYAFIRSLYDQIIIPPTVFEEVTHGYQNPQNYLVDHAIVGFLEINYDSTTMPSQPKISRLHEGEKQAIGLALSLKLPLLIEERMGRQVATKAGLTISGIAGQVITAFRQRIISKPEAQILLLEMLYKQRISEKLHHRLSDWIAKA